MAEKSRMRVSEAQFVRLVAYALFVGSGLGLMWTLAGSAWPWTGFAAGALVFGVPAAVLAYRHAETATIARERTENRGGSSRFDAMDDES